METNNLTSEQEQAQDALERWMSDCIADKTSPPAIVRCFTKIQEDKHAKHISTGFPQLDSILGDGLRPGLYIVGAVSSLGKTAFCLQVADQIARDGHGVLFFSLEMSEEELLTRSFSRLSFLTDKAAGNHGINAKTPLEILHARHYRTYSAGELSLIQQAMTIYLDEYARNVHVVEGENGMSISEIQNAVAEYKNSHGDPPVVIIDYLQILAPSNDRNTDKQNTDVAMTALKQLSHDYGIPVIAISSLNRSSYDASVNMASYKESGAVEYSSDILIGMQYAGMTSTGSETGRERKERIRSLKDDMDACGADGRPQKIQVKILKNRGGIKGSLVLRFYPKYSCFLSDSSEDADNRDKPPHIATIPSPKPKKSISSTKKTQPSNQE